MNEHDRDLILGLADGSLTGGDAASARAHIAADPELTAELETQSTIRNTLTALPDVALTDAERANLRSSLRSQLHLDTAGAESGAPRPVRRGIRWWQPAFGIAAVAVVVTAIIVLPDTLGSDDAETAGGEALSMTTTMAADESATADGGADVFEMTESDTDLTTVTGASAAPVAEVPELHGVDGTELIDSVGDARTPEEASEALRRQAPSAPPLNVDVAAVDACLEMLGDDLPPGDKTLIGGDATEDGLIVYLVVLDTEGVEWAMTLNLDECAVIDVVHG